MKRFIKILLVFSVVIALYSCNKWDDYKKFQENGEIVYPRKGDVVAKPGRNRILIAWSIKGDKNLIKYKLYWNNRSDSLIANIPDNVIDTVFIYHNNLKEQTYNYELYSIDKQGRKSVANNFSLRSFGDNYQSGLVNRTIKSSAVTAGKLLVIWNMADTVNTKTVLNYTGTDNLPKIAEVPADILSSTLSNWKSGTRIYIRSSYKPTKASIDEFTVAYRDSIY